MRQPGGSRFIPYALFLGAGIFLIFSLLSKTIFACSLLSDYLDHYRYFKYMATSVELPQKYRINRRPALLYSCGGRSLT